MAAMVPMHSTAWCGHCRPLKRQLDGARIPVAVVDLDEPGHANVDGRIIRATRGFRIVPTVEVDGELL